jgi:hypothetical protein
VVLATTLSTNVPFQCRSVFAFPGGACVQFCRKRTQEGTCKDSEMT